MEAAAVADLSSEKLKGEMWQQRKVHGNEGSASSFMEKDLVSGPESSHVEYSGLKERKDCNYTFHILKQFLSIDFRLP
jgi:hypothetical protein